MNLKTLLIPVSMFVVLYSYAQQAPTSKFGKGILNLIDKDSTWSMKIGARMQFLALADKSLETTSESMSSFSVRRARLKFDGFAFSPKLRYKLELGLSNNDMSGANEFTSNAPRYIYDAVLKWNFYKNFELWFGQTKLPGNRERVISSGDMQLVDRSLLNSNFNIDRDLGIQIRHYFKLSQNFIVKEVLAISQGEGRNVTKGNIGGYQYTTRLELLPLGNFTTKKGDYKGGDLAREPKPKIAFGVTYDFNHDAVKTRSNMGGYMKNDVGFYHTNISTLFIDTMFKYKGFSFMGEYAYRSAKDPIAKNSDGSILLNSNNKPVVVQEGNALNLQSGYLLTNNWEVSGRYTNINFNQSIINKKMVNQYTVGLSKYIAGHKLKVQTDFSYLDALNTASRLLYRLQVDIHF
ncbi:porin [Tenacibaculum sp. TC6]|uniref:porin n=1 Tax=Tenacibaculum sp. TC6 TaxID=3423223 RepID=UPI003D35F3B8